MTQTKHTPGMNTPGPWNISEIEEANDMGMVENGTTINADCTVVAEVCGGLGYGEHEANCLLISAAPDLAQALRQLIGEASEVASSMYLSGTSESLSVAYHLRHQVNLARAALARAEGKGEE